MKKTFLVFLSLAVSFTVRPCLASDKLTKFVDSTSILNIKEVESVRTLSGGLTFTLYKDGSSKTVYPSGKVIDRPPMLK